MRGRFLALTLIWGASFLFIKIGLTALAPLQIALGRMLCGTFALSAIAVARRESLPRKWRVWAHLNVAALLLNTIPFALFGYAEQHITTALASIANATTPLFTLLVALLALPDERPTLGRTVGLGLGFAGVLVVMHAWGGLRMGSDLTGMLFGLGAAALYGLGSVYLRRFLSGTSYSSLALSTGQLIAGTLQLLILVPLATQAPKSLPLGVIAAVAALGALGTGVAYLLQYGLIREAGATLASTVTYFLPVVSIGIGVLALGERLTWNQPLGAAIIVAGAALSRRAPPVRPVAAEAAAVSRVA
jgi:drug/metabolite transporter (DMT)-like permease